MAQQNPKEEAFAFYQRVVDKAIKEIGMKQVGNIDLMREMIRQSPKAAQIVIQLLYQISKDAPVDKQSTAQLHSLWLTIAYLLEYGTMDPSSLILKQMAPDLYDAAVKEIDTQGL